MKEKNFGLFFVFKKKSLLKMEPNFKRKTGFGFSSRDSHRSIKTDMPGPGHYNPRDFDKLISPSFK